MRGDQFCASGRSLNRPEGTVLAPPRPEHCPLTLFTSTTRQQPLGLSHTVSHKKGNRRKSKPLAETVNLRSPREKPIGQIAQKRFKIFIDILPRPWREWKQSERDEVEPPELKRFYLATQNLREAMEHDLPLNDFDIISLDNYIALLQITSAQWKRRNLKAWSYKRAA